jgi:hypothetical protein
MAPCVPDELAGDYSECGEHIQGKLTKVELYTLPPRVIVKSHPLVGDILPTRCLQLPDRGRTGARSSLMDTDGTCYIAG